MERLLSLAFDGLASNDDVKIRRNLNRLDNLLASICLADAAPKKQQNNSSSGSSSEASNATPAQERRSLGELAEDPAFRAFFKLQDSFEWNIVSRLIALLDKLLARSEEGDSYRLILSALELVQGIMLLHPPSKILFMREPSMNILLDLLVPGESPNIQEAAILTLVTALIDTPQNIRTFERLDGLLVVTSLFKDGTAGRKVKLKVVEFFYFYLMPETQSIPRGEPRGSVPALLQRSPSKLAKAFSGHPAGSADVSMSSRHGRRESTAGEVVTLSTEEKQALLGRHLSTVNDLVRDLRNCTPFGVVC